MWSVAVVDTDRDRTCADADRDAVGDVGYAIGEDAVGDIVGGVVLVRL